MKFIQRLIKSVFWLLLITVCVACGSKGPSKPKQETPVAKPQPNIEIKKSIDDKGKREYHFALQKIKESKLDEAEDSLQKLMELYPDVLGIYINLGIVQIKKSQWPQAENYFSQALKIAPNNAKVMNYLGIVFRQQGRFKEAETAYQSAINLDESYSQAYLNLGILYDLYLADFQAARQHYEKFSLFSPEDQKIKDWLADLDQRQKAAQK